MVLRGSRRGIAIRRPRRAALRSAGPVALCAVLLAGCAAALPALPGGRTTPLARTDLALGGAARIPLGNRDALGSLGGGLAPLVAARHGLLLHTDLGLMVVGMLARVELRQEAVLSDDTIRTRLSVAAAPFGGVDTDGAATIGAELPLLLGIDGSSVIELWVGCRPAVLRAPYGDGASATVWRLGAVVGLAVGFRRVHALVELTADYEHRVGPLPDGVVLTPGFALRLRL